jgi:hypothetical protein
VTFHHPPPTIHHPPSGGLRRKEDVARGLDQAQIGDQGDDDNGVESTAIEGIILHNHDGPSVTGFGTAGLPQGQVQFRRDEWV